MRNDWRSNRDQDLIGDDDPGAAARDAEATLARLPLMVFDIAAAGRPWQIEAVRDQDALIAAADGLAAFPYGLMIWESSIALADALLTAGDLAGRRVLELGAGAGIAGLAARHLGALVVQTDHAAEALALCRRNARRNGVDGIECRLGDWTQWQDAAHYDLILGADILYDSEAHAPVRDVLGRNLAAGGTALLTDPCRGPTSGFVAALENEGWAVARRLVRVAALNPIAGRELIDVAVLLIRR